MADQPSPDAARGAAGGSATSASDTATGGAPGAGPAEGVNQGATGNRPIGESPLSAQATEKDAFAERPEAFVGAAFAGGLALALIMRRLAR
jgi:hypothetical protein